MPAHIDLELTTRATPLPIGYAIACAIEPGTAAQIEIADEHAAEMGDVADVVAGARAERQEEFDGARADDIDLHGDGTGEGHEPEAAVQEDVGHRLPKVQLEKKIEWDEPEFTIHQAVGGWVK